MKLRPEKLKLPEPVKTLVYCRVSSKKQLKEGDGLASQETRLRIYAQGKAQPVVQVFSDNLTGSEQRRPGLQALLAFLRDNPHTRYRVLFDHLDRWVRDTNLSADLDRAVTECGAVLESPGVVYDGTSSSRLLKHVTVAFADYHRVNNAEQTVNRMTSRIMNGFAAFAATVGYRYGRVSGLNGRVLIPQEPAASVVREGL
jgi:site-specific DNA recombinase